MIHWHHLPKHINKLLKENKLNKNFQLDDSDHRKNYKSKKKCGGNE